jgi:hypothetical protein
MTPVHVDDKRRPIGTWRYLGEVWDPPYSATSVRRYQLDRVGSFGIVSSPDVPGVALIQCHPIGWTDPTRPPGSDLEPMTLSHACVSALDRLQPTTIPDDAPDVDVVQFSGPGGLVVVRRLSDLLPVIVRPRSGWDDDDGGAWALNPDMDGMPMPVRAETVADCIGCLALAEGGG